MILPLYRKMRCVIVMPMHKYTVQDGKAFPLGASIKNNGVNFCVFSHSAYSITLELFENETDETPCFSVCLDSERNRSGDLWHVFIEGIGKGALYTYRADGPFKTDKGQRFDKNRRLFDPYAKALTNASVFLGQQPKCVVVDDDDFDWQGDRPLNRPIQNTVIYETHLKGFTRHNSANTAFGGTYRAFIEKIPYLKELGITAVEFLPLQEFDENENKNHNPKTNETLKNFWGYSTLAFFAPKASYAYDKKPGACVTEFKKMVREMHKNGLEVILDVVFNHSAEGNENGTTLNFRGFENSVYYLANGKDKSTYANFSGCGNTLNCNHPIVFSFILDCLHYWVSEMHVDGFRFDLASVLTRDQNGQISESAVLPAWIAEDALLRNTKIIAEAWDCAGAYQVGSFSVYGRRWAEWNDRFRNDVRRFWKADDFTANAFATRLAGSSDLYAASGRKPYHSVNYITSHDGFTLNDAVSYERKHNETNGEGNADGSDANFSCNYGTEGPADSQTERLRARHIKNMLLTLFVSQGTPLLLAGDEFRRTQNGNNNAYCQDNEISWIDWHLKTTHKEIFEFTKKAVAFRLRHSEFRRSDFFSGVNLSANDISDINWFDEHAHTPDWAKQNHFIACRIDGVFYLMCNASDTGIEARLPPPSKEKNWYRLADTALPFPEDFANENETLQPCSGVYRASARSMIILQAK